MSSIKAVATQLRRGIALMSSEQLHQAMILFDEARSMLLEVSQGSQSWELPETVRLLTDAIERLRQAHQISTEAKSTAERYLTHIGASGSAGGSPVTVAGARDNTKPIAPPASTRPIRLVDAQLVAEVQRQGLKINSDGVVRIGRDPAGNVVWIEEGRGTAGVDHMLDPHRVREFADRGVAEAHIVDLVFQAVTKGTPVGISSRDRVVYETEYRGQTKRVAVTVASNGFIVGAHPIPLRRKLKPLQ